MFPVTFEETKLEDKKKKRTKDYIKRNSTSYSHM